MHLTNMETCETKELRNGRGTSYRLINPNVGCDYLSLHVNVLAPDSGPGPYHYHSNADNIYFVLSGRAKITVGSETFEAGPGDAMLISPGERHDVENIGSDELRVIEVKVPADSDFLVVEQERTG